MAFNIALSGLNAAQTDLDVKGNNIANASTTGFKRSRTEFGDLYSSGLQNLGDTSAGDGVSVQNTRQLFQQGNITATSNGLDMAIDGEGFFVLEGANGERQFSRAGQFGVDEEGFVTNNQGARVQGFQANESGQVGDVRGDLEVNTENLAPKSTTNVAANLNLDSRESVLRVDQTVYEAAGDGIDALRNGAAGFDATEFTVTDPDGGTTPIPTNAGESGASIAARFANVDGVDATAGSAATVSETGVGLQDGDQFEITLSDGESFGYPIGAGDTLQNVADAINADGSVALNASINGGNLKVNDNEGRNLEFGLTGSNGSQLEVDSDDDNTGPQTLESGNNASYSVLGNLTFTVREGYDLTENGGTEVLSGSETGTDDPQNAFNRDDSNTYNHSTSTTIYDSLGNPHEMTQYFVKEDPANNAWKSYVEIDGERVGKDGNGPDGEDGFELVFEENGSLDTAESEDVLINNWVPKDEDGNYNGAERPDTTEDTLPLDPDSNSSNFVIDYSNTTQVGSGFAVNDLQQNGFATGRLTGLDVSEEGVIQARFSNGESEALGQIALANFRNNEGLAPVGDTAWVETIDSGDAVISRPNTGPLGAIQSSSVEESNVDLSEQLVGLITAQRNFQANSKTIETSDQITQTIINLR
ncbi:flagellar hook protein FlgE [uncultured Halovibrio sp.]|uniref:flagellar hook protein FlgE n=1 Tax=uncultured Halovibrio sp. TaxID=985049 RepID=UPI0025FC69C4|nr:flagellar hook protein FlgE [uncultured Halovibrio sp.]